MSCLRRNPASDESAAAHPEIVARHKLARDLTPRGLGRRKHRPEGLPRAVQRGGAQQLERAAGRADDARIRRRNRPARSIVLRRIAAVRAPGVVPEAVAAWADLLPRADRVVGQPTPVVDRVCHNSASSGRSTKRAWQSASQAA